MGEIFIDCDGTYFDTYREMLGSEFFRAPRAPKPTDIPGKPTVDRDVLPMLAHFVSAMENRKEFIPAGFPFTACMGGAKRISDADIRPGIDCLIDDNLEACMEMTRRGGAAFLLLQPWHTGRSIPGRIQVAPNLKTAIQWAEEYMLR